MKRLAIIPLLVLAFFTGISLYAISWTQELIQDVRNKLEVRE